MSTSIFDYWSGIPGDTHFHPDDKTVLDRADHSFRLEGLPNPYFGRLRDARVVLLYLSPGWRELDAELAQNSSARQYFQRQRTGTALLPTSSDYRPTWNWWTARTRQLGLDEQESRQNVAFLNICAYRSAEFKDWRMLASLPSSRVSVAWAQSTLFPDAEAGRRIVICLRAAQCWGLAGTDKTYGISLFAPKVTRSGMMLRGSFRDDIVAAVRTAIRTN